MKLGDAVAVVAQPIARGIDFALGTNIQGCAGCGHRQIILNQMGEDVWTYVHRFYKKGKVMAEEEKPQWVVTKQFLVEAEDPEEALIASKGARPMSVNVTPRPTVQQMQPGMQQMPVQPAKKK
jgi:hypothetical protein